MGSFLMGGNYTWKGGEMVTRIYSYGGKRKDLLLQIHISFFNSGITKYKKWWKLRTWSCVDTPMPFSTFERQNLTFISKRGMSLKNNCRKKKRCEISWFKETHLNFSYLGRTWYRSSSDLRFSSRKACILSSAICSRLFAYSSIRKSRMSRKFSPDIPLSEKLKISFT